MPFSSPARVNDSHNNIFSVNISDKGGASTDTSHDKLKFGLRISDIP